MKLYEFSYSQLEKFYCENFDNSHTKLALYLTDSSLNAMSCKSHAVKLSQKLYSNYLGYGVLRNNFIFHLLENVTERLVPAGIPQHWNDFYRWVIFRPKNTESKQPKVLCVGDLEFGFFLWLGSCIVTCVIFFVECVLGKLKHVLCSILRVICHRE